ncbi:MAG TPA: hypothetical protein EYN92_02465 [Dehalococcoidia bacterium]|nr:hypothetical protein [Dehalococcoidia bacterium]
MVHSSSGQEYRPLEAEMTPSNSLPPATIPATGVAQAMDEYVGYLRNRGMSENHIFILFREVL